MLTRHVSVERQSSVWFVTSLVQLLAVSGLGVQMFTILPVHSKTMLHSLKTRLVFIVKLFRCILFVYHVITHSLLRQRWWSNVIFRSVILALFITHKRSNGRRPNMIGMGKKWPSRSDLNFGVDPVPDVDLGHW